MKIGAIDDLGYRYLGNFSAVDPVYSVGLSCDKCMVRWIGCYDQSNCPECFDSSDFTRLTERNYQNTGRT